MRSIRRGVAAADLAWLGFAATVLIGLLALRWLAPAVDGALAPPTEPVLFEAVRITFAPEPLEETRFLIAIALPVALALAVALLGANRGGERWLDPPIIAAQVASLGFVVWAATRQQDTLDGYHRELLLGVPVLAAGLIIGGALTALLLWGPRTLGPRARAMADRMRERPCIAVALAAAVTALWLLAGIVTDANVAQASLLGPHASTHMEEYIAVVNGRTPLVDFASAYSSLLPVLAQPLMSAFDGSLTAYSVIEVTLTFAAMMCIYAALAEVTRGRWTALGLYVPFLALCFNPWHTEGAVFEFNGLYYAVFPNRVLGPFVVIWLLARHLRRGSPPLWAVYLAAGLAVLNNFEFGITCLAALVAATAISLDRTRTLRRAARESALQAVAGLMGAFMLVSAVTLIRAGKLPDLSLLTYWSSNFGRRGYALTPMDSFGLHWAMFATYAGALVLAAVRFVRLPGEGVLTPMLAFAGLFGLATGQYFAGRSEAGQLMALFGVWAFALALLTWCTVCSLRDAEPSQAKRAVVPALAVLAGFGVMVAAVANFPPPWRQVQRIADGGPRAYPTNDEEDFIRDRTDPDELVLILNTGADHRIAERVGVTNVSRWGQDALFSSQDVNTAVDDLEGEQGSKLFFRSDVFPERTLEVEPILRERGYTRVARDPTTRLALWERSGTEQR